MKKVYIETMGCQMNKSDAERMFGMLEHLGYYQTEEPKEADMLIIGGTSLAVYPAAGLIDYYTGDKLVLINKTSTPRDSMANLVIKESIGEVFSKIQI